MDFKLLACEPLCSSRCLTVGQSHLGKKLQEWIIMMCSYELIRILFKPNLGHKIGLASSGSLQMPVLGPGNNLHRPHFPHRDIKMQGRRGSYGRAQSQFIEDVGLIIRSPGPTV